LAQTQPAPVRKNWKDNAEYEIARAAVDETDPAKKLADLDKWRADYPATEYIDERQGIYLTTYIELKQPRQAFDKAQEILKVHPDNFQAHALTTSQVVLIKPAPTAADLDTGEGAANILIASQEGVFAPTRKPPELTDTQWTQVSSRSQIKPFAEQVLISIYALRKEDKRAVGDLTKLIQKEPTLALASYQLGVAMIRVFAAEKRPEDQPIAFYHMARSIAVEGQYPLPAAQKKQILDYLTKVYTAFHGSADGLDQLLAMAKTSPFPPANFRIPSTTDVARQQESARTR
jgi:tetratricopeptide (TPR) repeat protein